MFPPEQIEFTIAYIPSLEGPVGLAARLLWREPRTSIPNERSIQALIERAFLNGYILHARYDDHARRTTRLTFARRPRYPHHPAPDFLP